MTDNPGALGDVRVVEMGQLLAGPFCGQLLGDFGAEVVKIEPPGSGDPMREWGREKPHGLSLWWPILARNKKSITLNLRTANGQALARRILARADVLVENFRPGTLESWGLAPAGLQAENPRLIIARVTGYGQDGPYAPRAGFGSIGEAMGGIRYVTGDPDKPPSRAGISLGDELAGTFAALGTLVALHARHRTGRGQIVDSALYEAVLALMESLIPDWHIAGYQRERTGSVLPNIAPSNVYPTKDGPVLIAANRDTIWRRLAVVMGQPELADDERYATHAARGTNAEELDNLIGAWTSGHSSESLLALLHDNGIPAGLTYRARDMLADPHYQAREAIIRMAHPDFGDFPMQNVFPKLSDTPGEVRALGPALGQHNLEIYGALLGMTPEEIIALEAAGTI